MFVRKLNDIIPISSSICYLLGASGSGKTSFLVDMLQKIHRKKIIFTKGIHMKYNYVICT